MGITYINLHMFRNFMDFKERLLVIMEQKRHWSDTYFFGDDANNNIATIAELIFHMQQEYGTYVKDFPRYLENILKGNPPLDVRASLLDNIREEDRGEISGFSRSHPEMFLDIPKGFGYNREYFENFTLLKESAAYKQWLGTVTDEKFWLEGLAVMTIFVEGNSKERYNFRSGPKINIEEQLKNHRLVTVYGLDTKYLVRGRARTLAG